MTGETGVEPGIDRCYCTTLRKASRRVSQFYDHMLMPTGLRATQYAILSTVKEMQELAVNQLAMHLDLDRTTTGKNLHPLEKAGLIDVVPSQKDGRSRTITLTVAGLAALDAATPLWSEAQRHFEQINGRESAAILRRGLNDLRVE